MRVVHCISALTLGGAEMMLFKIVTRMRGADSSIVVVTSDGPMGERFREAGVPVAILGKQRGRPDPRAVWRLRNLLRRERPDVLQTWMYEANLYGLAAGRLASVPRIVWNLRCSDMQWENYTSLSAVAFRLGAHLSTRADSILVNSDAGREFHVRHGYDGDRMLVVPNGFDLQEFTPDPSARHAFRNEIGAAPGTPVVGLLGRFDPMKDHATFIDAAARIAARRPDARFVLAGTGSSESNAPLVHMLRQTERGPDFLRRWHLLGRRRDVVQIMNGLDLLVLSSAYGEGFPNVVGEAMACGTPCAVTDVGDAASIVADTGRVVRPGEPAELASAVMEMLTLGPDRRAELGRRARRRIEERYDIDQIADRYRSLYETMLSDGRIVECVA